MALTKTVAEIKAMLPNFISNLSDPESFPNFDAAEYKYLVPITGAALFNSIHTKYNANTALSADEANLLKKMRLVTVAYAYHDGLILGQITLTDMGTKKINPNETVAVTKWEYEKLERNLLDTAYDATEILLRFLFEKKTAFNLWTASDEYTSFNSLLIKTGTDFSDQYTLYQPMRTFFNIRNVISDTQELYLQEELGEDLLSYILVKQDPDQKLKAIIRRLKKSLAFFTIKHCCLHYTVRFSHEGFTVLGGGNSESADHAGRKNAQPTDLDMKMNAADTSGKDFLAKAKYDLINYYRRMDAPIAEPSFKVAFESGPMKEFITISKTSSGNETRKGVFRL